MSLQVFVRIIEKSLTSLQPTCWSDYWSVVNKSCLFGDKGGDTLCKHCNIQIDIMVDLRLISSKIQNKRRISKNYERPKLTKKRNSDFFKIFEKIVKWNSIQADFDVNAFFFSKFFNFQVNMPLLNFEFKQLIENCVGRKIQNFVFWFSFFDTYKYGNKIFQKSNFLDIFRN